MSFDRIVCLANSYKHDHRCVAGISVITKKWIRLVGHQVPGCLTMRETCFSDGRQVALLDLFEAELGEGCGSNCHPEDVQTAGGHWRFLRRLDQPLDMQLLFGCLNTSPTILQGYGDRVSARRVEETPMTRSLELIEPEDLWWWIREEKDKRRSRGIFRVSQTSRIRYDFSVTDPKWLDQLNLLPVGIYPHSMLCRDKSTRTLLTLSLSEHFSGYHYKLIAGVINLPA